MANQDHYNHQHDEEHGSYDNTAEQLAKQAAKQAKNKVKQKAAQKVGGVAKEAGSAAAKGIGAAIKALFSSIAAHPFVWAIILFVLIIIIVVVIMLSKYVTLMNYIETTKKKVVEGISVVLNWDMYDEEKVSEWDNNGGDPDMTYGLYGAIKAKYDGEIEYAEGVTEEDIESIADIAEAGGAYLSPEDLMDVLLWSYEYNDEMFKYNPRPYKYHEWTVGDATDPLTGAFLGYEWQEGTPRTTTSEDELYGTLIAENIRGEKENGERIYTVHWQDVYALAQMYVMQHDEKWGTDEDVTYDPAEEGPYEINSTKEYWISEDDLDAIFSLFKYNFQNYYDGVEDKSLNAYEFEDLLKGRNAIGYRYLHDDDLSKETYDYRYYSSNDPGTVGGEYPRETRFIPDSAPNIVYNSIEQYKYAYVSTDSVDGYNTAIYYKGDYVEPPSGIYCVGKWKIVDPRPFVTTMAGLCPYHYNEAKDKSEEFNYIWSDEMLDFYIYYLSLTDMSLGTDRAGYYEHIKDLYREQKIEISYYGMKLEDSEMEQFIADFEAQNPGMTVEVNYDNAVEYGEWYEVGTSDPKAQADAGTIPFPSYGVFYMGSADEGLADIPDRSGNTHENNYTGEIYISMHGSFIVDDWIYLIDGADAPLDSGYSYTESEVRAMLSYMNSAISGRGDYDFTKATADVHRFNQDTGADVAAILAIILVENTPKVGVPTWNWLNFTPTASEKNAGWYYQRPYPSKDIENGRYWYNPKARFSKNLEGYTTLEGACLTDIMKKVYNNYWTSSSRKQNTYFRMCFNQYGWDLEGNTNYPQDWESALECEQQMESVGHCYCPWWEDAYVNANYDPSVLWCNKAAKNRLLILSKI